MLSRLQAAQQSTPPHHVKYFKERERELWLTNMRMLSKPGIIHELPHIDLDDHTATIPVHVGREIFQHSKAQLEFFSFSMREQLKQRPSHIILRNMDPYAWEMFTTFMITHDLDARLAGPHGAEMTCRDGVSLLVKVWFMAQYLGGACTLLQNLCIVRIMIQFVTMGGIVHSIPKPRDVEFALVPTEFDTKPQPLLIMFYADILARDGMEEQMNAAPGWDVVMERFLTFKCLLESQREMIRKRPELRKRPIQWWEYLARLDCI